jgi:hypothetical protein
MICANHRFEFHKRGQLFIRADNETLSVAAMCVCNEDCAPTESMAEMQPQVQPVLLRLSAMSSQYFPRWDPIFFALYTAMTR